MILSRWRSWVKVYVRASRPHGLSSFQPQEQFRAMIMRERAGADRNQHVFSLLLFNIGDPEANSVGVQYLAHVVANRIRMPDEVGWFDKKRIGVLLPYTSTDGAQKLADDICQAIAAKASPPEYTIYTYPFKWFSNGNGHLSQLHFSDLSPEWKTIMSRDISTAKHADGGSNIFGTQIASADTTLSSGILVQTIEPFFLNQLPLWKRAMDVVGALFGLVVLSPILLLVALIIKTVSPGPAFFKQQRIGHGGKTFTMLKFRTMQFGTDTSTHKNHVKQLINGANNGNSKSPMSKLENHPQIILFGKILRKTCIDELPQLINVLLGEMSLVGPRPPLTYEVEEYLQWNYARFNAVPGMTGLWQVSGKNLLTFTEMIQLDIQYSRKMSLWLDIKILLKTPLAIVSEISDTLASRKSQRLIGKVLETA